MARELVGAALVVDDGTPQRVVARLVEVEAYLGPDDPASHAHRGPTPRAAIMFGPAAHLYVYLSYGVHHCANIVTDADGTAGAVLLRAAAVEEGEDVVRARRGGAAAAASLLSGPGNLCAGLALTRADNGADLCSHGRLRAFARSAPPPLAVSQRVGISSATDRLLRFSWSSHPSVSRPQPVQKEGTG